MTQVQVTFDEDTLRQVLLGDKGAEVLLETVMNEILQAEMTEHLGAEPGEQTDQRTGYRNGSYERTLTTRVGTLDLEVPRDRDGTSLAVLSQRYQRSEKALVLTLMEMVVQGVSTRRVKKITTELCGREFSRQTVSDLTKRLDEQVRAWAERPLKGDYPFVMADAMRIKVRRQGAVRSTQALIVVGINEEGYREILGLKIALRETGESWKNLLQELKERGLSGVEVATSDAHKGLEEALQETFPGCIWQRCQSHFRRNVLDETPSGYADRMHELLDQILESGSQASARERLEAVTSELEEKASAALEVLEDGFFDATAVLALPGKYQRRLRTTNSLERLIQEIRRREKVIRIFPSRSSAWRLIGALLAETHEEWSTGRRYLKMDAFEKWRREQTRPDPTKQDAELESGSTSHSMQPA
ncbi:transposase-like protein [Salinibacter ruber]|uniref:IS256 family transposase n=1 Tax=Salinibacter ruber TaxID=146919 RepID=UPI002168C407|nr:IS256 family transposase [Salinibacter ruber]MCS3626855.1 transposase-like protein [Salinibacter ruber]MCS4143892.1 transposase-like protein [Salinibacter ruber]